MSTRTWPRLLAAGAVLASAVGLPAMAGARPAAATFLVGAAVTDFTPPRHLAHDPADCVAGTPLAAVFTGPRPFAFIEPYVDVQHVGHYVLGDPYVDCNHDGRWDGNTLGGGGSSPRFYDHVADPVGARAFVVSHAGYTLAVEVLDQEGIFNVYADQIRQRVWSDGYPVNDMVISATHDESAPDSLGLGGVSAATSGTNPYFVQYMVTAGARAIEEAYARLRPSRIRLAEAQEPATLRQCWSSYPYVDDPLVPALQAVGTDGRVIVTVGDVSQHAETLGFNPDPVQARWVSADWPAFFRTGLERRFGGVAVEMAGSVGSVETPQVFPRPVSRTPQQFLNPPHPAGCATLFRPDGRPLATGYRTETASLGRALAASVGTALARHGSWSTSTALWSDHATVCIPLSNALFAAAAAAGVFADRPGYAGPGCAARGPVLPNGTTAGDEVRTDVAAFRIGDAEFAAAPGEVFPFTFLRGFLGPADMPFPQYALPPWLMPYLHARFRFIDGLAEDMVGYVFPRGNGVGVPGERPLTNPTAANTDRFGCVHSDDSEAASSGAADLIGQALVRLFLRHDGRPESVVRGRYVLPDGSLSRNPLGHTDSVGCTTNERFRATGPAVAVWLADGRVVHPAAWLSLSGRAQRTPDRDTRGWVDAHGGHHWLDVFPDLSAPARVATGG